MPINIGRSQAGALSEGFFEQGGSAKTDDGISVSSIEQVLITWAGEFIRQSQENLRNADAVSSGELASSMKFDLVIAATKYRLDISMADYYDFVNKGVRGIESAAKAPGSPYQFRKRSVSKAFLDALTKWVRREGLKSRIIPEAAVTERVYKRKAKVLGVQDKERQLAYLIGRSIKRKGVRRTGFLDNAYADLYPQLGEDLAKALGEDVSKTFRRLQTKLG
jgi:hypothetical protein